MAKGASLATRPTLITPLPEGPTLVAESRNCTTEKGCLGVRVRFLQARGRKLSLAWHGLAWHMCCAGLRVRVQDPQVGR
jgi:hypothetical protein